MSFMFICFELMEKLIMKNLSHRCIPYTYRIHNSRRQRSGELPEREHQINTQVNGDIFHLPHFDY